MFWSEKLTGKGFVIGLMHDDLNSEHLLTAYRGDLQYRDSSSISPIGMGLIKLSSQGHIQTTKFVKGPDGALAGIGYQIHANKCYLTGVIKKAFQFDNITLTGDHEFGGDMFLAKLSLPAYAVNLSEIKKNGLNNWHVYPNPTNNYVRIEFKDQLFNSATLTVRNLLGQTLETVVPAKTEQGYNINLGKYAKGIYCIEISTETGREVRKIILE